MLLMMQRQTYDDINNVKIGPNWSIPQLSATYKLPCSHIKFLLFHYGNKKHYAIIKNIP